jgi:hypothetical protein
MMMDEMSKHVLELKVQNAVTEEKIIALEKYMIVDLKTQMTEISKKAESRFRWTVALIATFTCTAIGVPFALCGAI